MAPSRSNLRIKAKRLSNGGSGGSATTLAKLERPPRPTHSSLAPTKRAKIKNKHDELLSKLKRTQKASIQKRRRPKNKLKGDIGSLAEALPDLGPVATGKAREDGQGTAPRKSNKHVSLAQRAIELHATIPSKKGGQRRLDNIAAVERKRMAANMIQLNADPEEAEHRSEGAPAIHPPQDSWIALREHIQASIKRPE